MYVVMNSAHFEVFRDPADGLYYFRLIADEDLGIVLISLSYLAKADCLDGIMAVKLHSPFDSNYERRDSPQSYTFDLWAGNWEIIAHGGSFPTQSARDEAIEILKRDAAAAPVIQLD